MKKEDFKYFDNIYLLKIKKECPDIIELDYRKEAYRYTYNKNVDENDFVPQALKLGRPLRKLEDNEEKACNDFGISLFNDETKAKEIFNGFTNRTKELLGYKFIAKGIITQKDGYITKLEETGHFNLHELKGCALDKKFINSNEL